MDEPQDTTLPSPQPSLSTEPASDEKAAYVGTPSDEKGATLDLGKYYVDRDTNEEPLYVHGEPIITSGRDVSKYLVDLRDDEDPPFTLRSIVLGTVIGGLGAALCQVCCAISDKTLDASFHTFASRYTSSSLFKKGSLQYFYSSSFTHLEYSGKPFCQSVMW
jgi:hypothetical protein